MKNKFHNDSHLVCSRIIFRIDPDNCEKRCCSGSHKQCKTLLEDHVVRFEIISLYIYKELRVKTNESCDDYHQDGNLVPSPQCVFCLSFEA